jgi:hypothetical protein
LINQFSYYSPDTIGGGTHLGWSLLVPVVSLDGDLGDNGVKLGTTASVWANFTVCMRCSEGLARYQRLLLQANNG